MNATDPINSASTAAEPPAGLPVIRRRRWWGVVVLLVVFVGGLGAGVVVTLGMICYQFEHRLKHPQDIPARVTHRLQRKLGLTDQQAQQVQDILTKRQASLMAIRREIQPQVDAEMDLAQSEIEAVLSEEQAKRCRSIFHKMRRRWMRGHHPPPHGPPPPCFDE